MKKQENYIIVEGEIDAAILHCLLPSELLETTKIVVGGGYNSSISLAKSLYSRGNNKVVVAIDSDSMDEAENLEKLNFIEASFSMIPSNSKYKVILFKPEIEGLFFYDEKLVKSVFNGKIKDLDIEYAKRDPRFFMQKMAKSGQSNTTISKKLLKNITDDSKKVILESEELKKMLAFLS